MHRWYVKARFQTDHDERAKVLGCDCVLEDTSSQVNPADLLPHVIIQVRNENIVFVEPVKRAELDSVKGDDAEPEEIPQP